jgi:hypothetical protein
MDGWIADTLNLHRIHGVRVDEGYTNEDMKNGMKCIQKKIAQDAGPRKGKVLLTGKAPIAWGL